MVLAKPDTALAGAIACLQLSQWPGLGSAGAHKLIRKSGSLQAAAGWSQSDWKQNGLPPTLLNSLTQRPDVSECERQLQDLRASGIECICWDDADYPPLLAECADAPLLMYARGRRELLQRPALAVVGSRKPGRQGLRVSSEWAAGLARAGLCIVSGAALGIDASAHEAALEVGGASIAVLGCGIDRVYPQRNRPLFERLCQQGLLLSEYAPGAAPQRHHFPRRNRVIAGLSLGVLVVEAARRSGSLITARLALDYNRDVFAVPGPVHQLNSAGCHELIRSGAELVTEPGHIMQAFEGWLPEALRVDFGDLDVDHKLADLSPTEQRLLERLDTEGQAPESLVVALQMAPAEVTKSLAALAAKGLAVSRGGFWLRA